MSCFRSFKIAVFEFRGFLEILISRKVYELKGRQTKLCKSNRSSTFSKLCSIIKYTKMESCRGICRPVLYKTA